MIYVVIVVTFSICSYVWKTLDVGYVQGMCDLVAPLLVIFDNGKLHASLHRTHASVYKRLKGWAIEFYPLALEPLVTALTRSQSSLSLSLIFTREARSRGARGVMGRRKERRVSLFVFLLPITPRAPFGHASRVQFLHPNVDREDWARVR